MPTPNRWGFKDQSVAETLKRVAAERKAKAVHKLSISPPENRLPNSGSYIIHLEDDLPAATVDDEGTVTLGESTGFVYRRETITVDGSEHQWSQNPDSPIVSTELVPVRLQDKSCNRRRIFNVSGTAYDACSYVEAVQDSYGDLYVSSDVLVTELTTTTAYPTVDSTCDGGCKYLWDDTSKIWELDTDNCGSTTSTTTTTTAVPTTQTTTTQACVCEGVQTTTTTTVPDCNCGYPSFCGQADGDCTWVDCVDTNLDQPDPPDCSGTTTSTTTSTTCNCDTSTTSTTSTSTTTNEEGCTAGCDWLSIPFVGWVKTSDGCSQNCPCSVPTDEPVICTTAHTPCVPIGPPGTTVPPDCEGHCIWWWNTIGWVQVENYCVDNIPCNCYPPSEPGDICGPVSTPCVAPTTTSTSTSTTAAPGPCAHCYTSSTTTTTPNPCFVNDCTWRWDTGLADWTLEVNDCPSSCPCYAPPFDGEDDCELRQTPCNTFPTTTTTTTCSDDGTAIGNPPGANQVGTCCISRIANPVTGELQHDCIDSLFQGACQAQWSEPNTVCVQFYPYTECTFLGSDHSVSCGNIFDPDTGCCDEINLTTTTTTPAPTTTTTSTSSSSTTTTTTTTTSST